MALGRHLGLCLSVFAMALPSGAGAGAVCAAGLGTARAGTAGTLRSRGWGTCGQTLAVNLLCAALASQWPKVLVAIVQMLSESIKELICWYLMADATGPGSHGRGKAKPAGEHSGSCWLVWMLLLHHHFVPQLGLSVL